MCQQLVKPNWAYVLGEFGILAIAEMVVSVVICACVSRGLCLHGCTGRNFEAVGAEGQHFVLLAASVCLIATLFFFLAHLTNLADWSRPRWAQMEFFISSASILLMFVAAVVESWYAGGHLSYAVYDHSAWVAAAVFAFALVALYAVNVWRLWKIVASTGLFTRCSCQTK